MRFFPILVALLIFVLPMNLFVQLHTSSSYVHGLQVDYLIPKLYVSDFVIMAILALQLIEVVKKKQKISVPLTGALLLGALALRQFFTENSIASVYFLIKLLEVGALATVLWQKREQLRHSQLVHWALLAAMLFQSLVGLGQFWQQTSIFPSYLFFGESRLLNPIGLAKASFGAAEKILPYGTTPHPNILAGFLVIGVILMLQRLRQHTATSRAITAAVLLLSLTTIFLTQSWSAWLSLGIGCILTFWPATQTLLKKAPHLTSMIVFTSLVLVPATITLGAFLFPNNLSLTRRDILQTAAIRMFVRNPIAGVGLNNFTVKLEDYANSREVVRFVQPVHNVGWLWLSETGVLGIAVLAWICRIISQKKSSIIVFVLVFLPIITLDHYLLSKTDAFVIIVMLLIFAAIPADKNNR